MATNDLEDNDFPTFCFENEEIALPVSESEATAKTMSGNQTTTASVARFPNLSEDDLQKIIQGKQSDKTKKTTNWCVSTFKGIVIIIYFSSS